jgi:hypothetical protein
LKEEPVTSEARIREGSPESELALLEDARIIPVPYEGSLYTCPMCEKKIPTRLQIRLAKPPRFETLLNDILKCPYCKFIFSPRTTAVVLRR